MTEGSKAAAPAPAPATAPGSQRRKPRRKRNAGKKNESSFQQKGGKGGASKSSNKKSASGGNNGNSPPPPPQIKITIRNIQNSEKFGSVKSVLEGLISKLIDSCVEKKANNQYAIELDRTAVRHLITEEEKIEKRRKLEEKQRQEEKDSGNDNENNVDNLSGNNGIQEEREKIVLSKGEEEKQGEKGTNERKDTINNDRKLDVIIASKIANNLPTIIARPLYIIPPRKTRRRGERGGTAYMLLIGPKIERKKPSTATNSSDKNASLVSSQNQPEKQEEIAPEEVTDNKSGNVATTATHDFDSTSSSKPSPDTTITPEIVVNYPQELAKGRLLLSNTIKSLTELAVQDSKSQEFVFSGCIIEQSMNGKTWKIFQNKSSRPDRREGTIQSTADFKDWLETIAKQKEELKARPKPVPGGGVAAVTTTTTTSNGDEIEEDGQPVSSLVQHLRAKKLDAKRKKSQKKKKKEESNKAAKSNASKSNNSSNNSNNKGEAIAGQVENEKKKRNEKKNRKNNNNSGIANGKKGDAAAAAAAAKKAKRKKKERAKKKEKAKAAAAAAASGSKAPTSLLKPQSSST